MARLEWLASRLPKGQLLQFWSTEAKYLFEEARLSFVYGLFLAATLLGFGFIERTLASRFFAAGRRALAGAAASRLLSEALAARWLTEDEYRLLDAVRSRRNAVSHHRAPLSSDTIPYRVIVKGENPYAVMERDARSVMEAVMHVLGRSAIG